MSDETTLEHVWFYVPQRRIVIQDSEGYQEEIQFLQEKNDKLKKEVQFLKKQLEYKSFGLPNYVRESVHYK